MVCSGRLALVVDAWWASPEAVRTLRQSKAGNQKCCAAGRDLAGPREGGGRGGAAGAPGWWLATPRAPRRPSPPCAARVTLVACSEAGMVLARLQVISSHVVWGLKL